MQEIAKARKDLHKKAEKARLRGRPRAAFEAWARKALGHKVALVGEKCFEHILAYSFEGWTGLTTKDRKVG